MKIVRVIGVYLFLLLFCSQLPAAQAALPSYRAYRHITTITGPSIPPRGKWNFDISWIDQEQHLDYFADSTNARVDIFNTRTNRYVGSIRGFTGYYGSKVHKGPDGLLTDRNGHLWVGDGNSTVKVVSLASRKIITSISTGGRGRADEMTYAPELHLLAVTNGTDTPPFLTFIDTRSFRVVSKIHFPQARAGLEQPLWDTQTQRFYLSIPSTAAYPGGELVVIHPRTKQVERVIPLPYSCHPTGLVSGPGERILVGCDGHPLILDGHTGRILTVITQVSGVDEVWYNHGDHRYYLAAGDDEHHPSIGVVDALTLRWLTGIPVAPGAHSVAVDAGNNHIFVPENRRGIGVYQAT